MLPSNQESIPAQHHKPYVLTRRRMEDIDALALDAFQYSVERSDDPEKQGLPINLRPIAMKYHTSLTYATFKDNSNIGAFRNTAQKRDIFLNKNASYEENAFAASHFLGHLVLGHSAHNEFLTRPRILQIDKQTDREEQEADFFAVSLPMPEYLARRYRRLTDDNDKIRKIFAATPYTNFCRLKFLGLL